jgi:hypothetical protein
MSFCDVCGTQIPEGSKFCPSCGAEVKAKTNNETIPPQEPPIITVENPVVIEQPDVSANQPVYQTEQATIGNQVAMPDTNEKTMAPWLGLGAFVLSIIAIFTGNATVTIILSVVAFVLAIVALVKKGRLKGFPIAALVIASLCVIISIIVFGVGSLFKNGGSELAKDVTEKVTEKVVEEADEALEKKADPELVAFLDEYEAFVDAYVEFMQNYSSDPSNAINMLGEYTDMLTKLAEYSSKLEKYDTKDMSAADAAYYLEVTARCAEKMLKVAGSLGDN